MGLGAVRRVHEVRLDLQDPVQVEQADAGDVDLVVLVHRHRLPAGQVQYDGVEVCQVAVEVVVSLQDHSLADLVLLELERSRPIGRIGPGAAAGLNVLPVQHVRRRIGELGQEVGFGGVDRNLQRAVVDDLDAANFGGVALDVIHSPDDVVQIGAGNGRCGLRVRGPFQ